MGWWETKAGELLGDGPLDRVEDFLRQLTNEYTNELGRKPTLDEILACLATVLYNRAEEFAADGDEILVTAIIAKTKKRPKKQIFKPGDVFTVPFEDRTYGFGRVTPQYGYVEFFRTRRPDIPPVGKLRGMEVIRFPFMTASDALEEWQWKVIGTLPFATEEFIVQPFRIGNTIPTGYEVLRDGFVHLTSETRLASPEEMLSVPPYSVAPPNVVVEELQDRLKGM